MWTNFSGLLLSENIRHHSLWTNFSGILLSENVRHHSLIKSIWFSESRKLERSVLVSSSGGWQTIVIHRLNSAYCLVLYSPWAKCGFYVFKCLWKKNRRRIIFCDMWKLHEIQISVSINKVLLEHSHIHLFTVFLGLFLCYSSRIKELQRVCMWCSHRFTCYSVHYTSQWCSYNSPVFQVLHIKSICVERYFQRWSM